MRSRRSNASTGARSRRRTRPSLPISTSSSARCRGSPPRPHSSRRGGPDDPLVDRRRTPACSGPARGRVPAEGRARRRPRHRAERAADRGGRTGRVQGPRRCAAAAHNPGARKANGRGRRELRRLPRRDHRRRGGGVAMPAAGVVLVIAVLLIVLALVYYLVSTIVALRQITSGLDEAIAGVGEIIEKSAPVEDV